MLLVFIKNLAEEIEITNTGYKHPLLRKKKKQLKIILKRQIKKK